MLWRDSVRLVLGSIRSQPLRTSLTAGGIAIGIMAVVLLTAMGSGLQRYVLSEFTQFGTNLLAVVPGKAATFGSSTGLFGGTKPLSLEDAEALGRLPFIEAVVPVLQGNAEIKAAERSRRSEVLGVGPGVLPVWRLKLGQGRFLPDDDARAARSFAVLGAGLSRELFPHSSPLGQTLRVGGSRFRVIGVMEQKGQILGFDIDNILYIPAARALELFNREGLMEVDLLYRQGVAAERLIDKVQQLMEARHGREDFSVVSQKEMLSVMGNILDVLTLSVAALGGISLFVGAVGILTIMTISVNERVSEVGLLAALGADRRQILRLFLGEALLLGLIGGLLGLLVGGGIALLLSLLVAALPLQLSLFYSLLALLLSALIGLLAGVGPAYRAAKMDPIEALRSE